MTGRFDAQTVFVPGTPVPQGSSRAFVINGRARITAANTKTRPWRADIQAVLRDEIGDTIPFQSEAVDLNLIFVMPRRAAEPKTKSVAHTRKPDLDKLVRAVLDAATGILYTDDSQVVGIRAAKRTAIIAEQPGLHLACHQWGMQ